jgi:hypothetical protein
MLDRRAVLASLGVSGSAAIVVAPSTGSVSASTWEGRGTSRSANRVITRDGISLFWWEWGQGPPVLFVHAWRSKANNGTINSPR